MITGGNGQSAEQLRRLLGELADDLVGASVEILKLSQSLRSGKIPDTVHESLERLNAVAAKATQKAQEIDAAI